MSATFTHRALDTRSEVVADGRTVALRHSVPSDAPRLSVAFGPSHDVEWGSDMVAFDDHGAIVGHAASSGEVAVVPGWDDCGLERLLASDGHAIGDADATPALRDEAVKRLRKKQEFHAHALVFVLVNTVTWATWALMTSGGFAWPLILTALWGVGLVMNAWDVYGRRPLTEARIRAEIERLRDGG